MCLADFNPCYRIFKHIGMDTDTFKSYSVLTQPQTVQYSLLHTQSIWYSLLLLGYKPVQHNLMFFLTVHHELTIH